MITVRRAAERGHFNHGWLDTYHTFSFGEYHDRAHHHFRALRVMNEDRIAPGGGFPTHGHRDMEIVTVVLAGELAHRDSLGSGDVIGPDDVQHMTAGSGIEHSEFNASESEPAHLYQIWLYPESKGLPPGYSQRRFPREDRLGRWQTIAAPEGAGGDALVIRQDALLRRAALPAGRELSAGFEPERHGWLQVLSGVVRVGDYELSAGDGAAISGEPEITLAAAADAEVLLFDLA